MASYYDEKQLKDIFNQEHNFIIGGTRVYYVRDLYNGQVIYIGDNKQAAKSAYKENIR